jgi:16S rRNA (guanine527-N7)-methyltransferase
MIGDESTQVARSLLIEGLDELSLDADSNQVETLLELAQLLCHWSKRINLTGHRTAPEIVRRLILDAAALTPQRPEIASLADIGSGAGFPGLPIAVLRSDCQVTLVESRERRHHFQRQVIRQLGLGNVRAELGRAEGLEPSLHAAAIAQAVARPADALPLLLPWVEIGGLLLFPCSSPPPPIPKDDPRVRFEPCATYKVPLGGADRTLWSARKTPGNAA